MCILIYCSWEECNCIRCKQKYIYIYIILYLLLFLTLHEFFVTYQEFWGTHLVYPSVYPWVLGKNSPKHTDIICWSSTGHLVEQPWFPLFSLQPVHWYGPLAWSKDVIVFPFVSKVRHKSWSSTGNTTVCEAPSYKTTIAGTCVAVTTFNSLSFQPAKPNAA